MEVDAEKLLVLVEARPPIYNYLLKEHHNRDLIDKLWKEISIEMSASVTDCRTKWQSLRNSYARQLRAINKIPSGAGCSKKKKWYLFDAMSFLKDFMSPHKKMTSNYAESSVEENTNTDDFTERNSELSVSPTHSPVMTELYPPQPKVCQKPQSKSAAELVAGPMIAFLNAKTQKNKEDNNEGELDFFKSLIPDLKKLSSKRRRQFKTQVLHTLNKLMDEEEDECLPAANSVQTTPREEEVSRDYSDVFTYEFNV